MLSNIDEEIGDQDIDEDDEDMIREKLIDPELYSDFHHEEDEPAAVNKENEMSTGSDNEEGKHAYIPPELGMNE